MDKEQALKVLEEDNKKRTEAAKIALEKLCKEHNVEVIPVCGMGDQTVNVSTILRVPVGLMIIAK